MTTPHAAEPPGAPNTWPQGGFPPTASAPSGLARATIALAVAVTALEVVTVVAAWPAAADFYDAIRAGGSAGDVITLWDGLELLLFPLLIAAYVVTCLWLHAARRNTARISPATRHRRGMPWVWLGWWVPIVSVWFPYQVVRDVRSGSSTRRLPPGGLGIWWAAWLLYLWGTRVASGMAQSSSASTVQRLPYVEMAVAAAAVCACVAWVRIVRSITTAQEEELRPR